MSPSRLPNSGIWLAVREAACAAARLHPTSTRASASTWATAAAAGAAAALFLPGWRDHDHPASSQRLFCSEPPIRAAPYPPAEARAALPFDPAGAICLELPESENPLLYRQVLRYVARHGTGLRSFRIGGTGLDEKSSGLGWCSLPPQPGITSEHFPPIWVLHQTIGPACGVQLPRLYHSLVLFVQPGSGGADAEWAALQELCRAARREAAEPERPGVPVWRYERRTNSWSHIVTRPPRPWESVVLPEELQRSIEQDAVWFHAKDTKEHYAELGVPYRRAYLFSGPPGAGKTSAAVALAGRFARPICLFPEPDETLLAALTKAPSRALFLFEDVEIQAEGLRALLNGLDGVATPENSVFVLTTNSPADLEAAPALSRPGRIDMHFRFPPPDETTAEKLFLRFYASECAASEQGNGKWDVANMAQLQHRLLECHRRGLNATACRNSLLT